MLRNVTSMSMPSSAVSGQSKKGGETAEMWDCYDEEISQKRDAYPKEFHRMLTSATEISP